jgi:hypothetical protein
MADINSYELYKAYVCNVRGFLKTETELKRIINASLKRNKQDSVERTTKIYALLYSTFSEANFMKMILTPYGFSQGFVNQIVKESNVQSKWYKCIELGFHIYKTNWKTKKNSEIPNKIQELKRIVDRYVVSPSVIRNKIAHGQINIALNNDQAKLNLDLTQELNELNQVKIYIWFQIQIKLTEIIEDLIESPDKMHPNSYHSKIQNLFHFIDNTKNWNIESKMITKSMLKRKTTIS